MPSLSAARLAYLAAGDYTDCYCVRIVRTDGETFRFTSYATDLVMTEKWDAYASPQQSTISEVTYKSSTGYDMTAVEQTATLSIDNIDILGIYEASGIRKADLLAGVYDGAEVYVFMTNFQNPIEDEHPIKKAVYGITTVLDNTFKVEFRGLTQKLTQEVGRKITTLSSLDLDGEGAPTTADNWQATTAYSNVRASNDWRNADVVKPSTPNGYWYYLTTAGTSGASEPTWTTSGTVTDGTCVWTPFIAYSYTATVSSVTSNQIFTASGLTGFPDAWFTSGVLVWSDGDNITQGMEVIEFDNGSPSTAQITLAFPMPFDVEVGDQFVITVGYDRTLEQCSDRFDNAVNFGGFPVLPGPRTAAKIGGT